MYPILNRNGILIAIEGTDGSGKATQTGLLVKDLPEHTDREVGHATFPNYENDSSALVKAYLAGRFGTDPDSVNPYAASSFYAVDRYAGYKEQPWGKTYDNGGVVVCDRYTTANAVHQAEKVPRNALPDFLTWLFTYEYKLLGIPAPDLVVYLDMPTEVTVETMLARRAADPSHVTDIHEKSPEYLERCRRNGLAVAAMYKWSVISCARDGRPRTIEDIHAEIMDLVIPVVSR